MDAPFFLFPGLPAKGSVATLPVTPECYILLGSFVCDSGGRLI